MTDTALYVLTYCYNKVFMHTAARQGFIIIKGFYEQTKIYDTNNPESLLTFSVTNYTANTSRIFPRELPYDLIYTHNWVYYMCISKKAITEPSHLLIMTD